MVSPIVDEARIIKLIKYLEKTRTVIQLLKKLKISRRTLYRDFDRLEQRGFYVKTEGFRRPTKYFLEE